MGYATHITDWTTQTADTKRGLKYVIEPETIYPGDVITVSIYDVDSYDLESPYGGLFYGRVIGLTNGELVEAISFSGSADVNSEFPVFALENIVCQLGIVDETSRELIRSRGQVLNEDIVIVDADLKADFGVDVKPHGTAKVFYSTFKAQIWKHSAFSEPGAAVLFARNLRTEEIELINLTIAEIPALDTTGIILEGHDRNLANGAYLSHTFRLSPADNNILLRSRNGTITEIPGLLIPIDDSVSFSGSNEASAKHYISSLVYPLDVASGFFLDEEGFEISPSLWLSDGKIKSNVKISQGTISLTYLAAFRMFNYFREQDGTVTKRGSVVAYRQADQAIAVYHIPIPTDMGSPKQAVARVYRVTLVAEIVDGTGSPNGNYEMPTTFTNSAISYLSYPGADTSNLTTSAPKIEVDQSVVYWDGISCWSTDNAGLENWAYPSPDAVTPFDDVKWEFSESLPSDVDSFDAGQIRSEIDRVRFKYGIA